MQQNLLPEESRKPKVPKFVRRCLAGVLAGVMTLSTTVLMAPDVFAREQEETSVSYTCGLEEHTHTDDCYQKVDTVQERELTCTLAAQPALTAEGDTVTIVHKHDGSCYEDGTLVCTLTEREVHIHTDDCYGAPVYHSHSESCCTVSENPACGKTEGEGHTHSDACTGRELTCQLHVCGEECEDPCTVEQDPHTHTDECYQDKMCPLPEAEAHTHSEACNQSLTCGKTEETVESKGEPTCGKEELQLHSHAVENQCYLLTYHADGTIDTKTLNCDTPVVEEHVHTDACFTAREVPASDIDTLTCGKEASEEHEHTGRCYGTWELVCGAEEHTYDETCDPLIGLSEEDRAKVQAVIDAIEKMPSASEIEEKIRTFSTEDEEIAWLEEVYQQVYDVYDLYDALSEELKVYVTNTDKLLELEYIWSARPLYDRAEYSLGGTPGVSTKDFIEINLKNYGSDINNKYNSNKKYPGFQLPNATKGSDVGETLTSGSFNFGDAVTADEGAKQVTHGDDSSKGAINEIYKGSTYGTINIPISGAIAADLGDDGYPVLTEDHLSLDYLFEDPTNPNMDKLFKFDAQTNTYSFDSRRNHAQINGKEFLLFDELITSNAFMYPFGNFLPFNDINTQTTRAEEINAEYIADVAKNIENEDYKNGLLKFNQLMGSDWAYLRARDTYLNACQASYNGVNPLVIAPADALYNIDFDEKTDFFFGMDIHTNFFMPKDGRVNDKPMKFRFTGDDDVMVYIDGKLFLDLSGIHRHVGGEIDFEKGTVSVYPLVSLSSANACTIGYIDWTKPVPNLSKKFVDILGSGADLENGTFKDFSTHTFDFFYMERGSGSSVCSIEFNFPLLKKNTITVEKQVTFSDEVSKPLGNPPFRFQVLKANADGTKTDKLFIESGAEYTWIKADGTKNTAKTDGNGVFTLKNGEKAEFANIPENAGKYYVRELLDPNVADQYEKISVDGSTVTETNHVMIGQSTFQGRDSGVKDISDGGATYFKFDNHIDPKKMGSLEISKVLTKYDNAEDAEYSAFDIVVELDGVEREYQLPAGETLTIDNIVAGTTYKVYEENASGYMVEYSVNGAAASAAVPTGIVPAKSNANSSTPTVKIVVNNTERGIQETISGTKILTNPDGDAHTFYFTWVAGTYNETSKQFTEQGQKTVMPLELTANVGSRTFSFSQKYTEKMLAGGDSKDFYYKVYESDANGTPLPDSEDLNADQAAYIVKVTVAKDSNAASGLNATKTILKDGQTVNTITFTNTLVGKVTIHKTLELEDGSVAPSTPFKMDVTITAPDGQYLLPGMVFSYGNNQSYTVESRQERVEITGIEVPVNGSVTISGIPVGSNVSATEQDNSRAGYTVTVGDSVFVDKTIQTITVNNKEQVITLNIPATKKISNPDGEMHTFDFSLEEVNASGESVENGVKLSGSVELKDEKTFTFPISYKTTMLNDVMRRTFYYRITESTLTDMTVITDPAVYLVQVTLTTENGQLVAGISEYKKDSADVEAVAFENTLLGELTLSKQIIGEHPKDETFQFTIGGLADNDYAAKINGKDTVVTVVNGKYTVKLGHKDTLEIFGIPHGTKVTVTEAKSAYTVRYTVNSGWIQRNGNQVTAEVTTNGTEIFFKNYSPYGLPQTGQLNWPIPVLAILGVACVGGAFLLMRRKKGKHEK